MPNGARDAVLLNLFLMLEADERLKQFETSYSRDESLGGKIGATIVCYVQDQDAANEILAMAHAESPLVGLVTDRTLTAGTSEDFTIRVYVTQTPKLTGVRMKKGKK